MNRYLHGEFDSKDSIQVADSLKFKTLKGRVVYGGGGIMPDIFVPRDTSEYTNYLSKSLNYGYLYQFAFKYTDTNRKKLSTFKSWQAMEQYLNGQNLLSEFTAFATTKGLKPNNREIAISKRLILNQIESYITRNTLGDNGFYPLFFRDDKTVLKALEVISKTK
jgi:carboxyl-terminal processing protease